MVANPVIQAGANHALLVDADADIPASADAAVWGGMVNAGQTPLAVGCVYVHEKVYDRFADEVAAREPKAASTGPSPWHRPTRSPARCNTPSPAPSRPPAMSTAPPMHRLATIGASA